MTLPHQPQSPWEAIEEMQKAMDNLLLIFDARPDIMDKIKPLMGWAEYGAIKRAKAVRDSIVLAENRSLIEAAPDLLVALEAMVLNDKHTYRDCHKAAVAAIAKARS